MNAKHTLSILALGAAIGLTQAPATASASYVTTAPAPLAPAPALPGSPRPMPTASVPMDIPMPYAVHRSFKRYEDGSVTVRSSGYFKSFTTFGFPKKLANGMAYAVLGSDVSPPRCVRLELGTFGCLMASGSTRGKITITKRNTNLFQFWATFSYCRANAPCDK